MRVVHRTPSHYTYSPNRSKAYFLVDLKSISPATTSTNDIPNRHDVKSQGVPFISMAINQVTQFWAFAAYSTHLQQWALPLQVWKAHSSLIPALRVQGRELTSVIASLACQLDRYCFDQPDNRDRCLTPDTMNWDPPGLNL